MRLRGPHSESRSHFLLQRSTKETVRVRFRVYGSGLYLLSCCVLALSLTAIASVKQLAITIPAIPVSIIHVALFMLLKVVLNEETQKFIQLVLQSAHVVTSFTYSAYIKNSCALCQNAPHFSTISKFPSFSVPSACSSCTQSPGYLHVFTYVCMSRANRNLAHFIKRENERALSWPHFIKEAVRKQCGVSFWERFVVYCT